jgi:hypothetical protein
MKTLAPASICVLSLLANTAFAGEAPVKCTAQALDVEGKPAELTIVRYAYGKSKDALTKTYDKPWNDCGMKFTGLDAGTWYFAARSVAKDGTQSELSNIVDFVIAKAAPVAPVLEK